MPFDQPYHSRGAGGGAPEWTITVRGWRALVLSYICVFACVIGLAWMFLSAQQLIANLFSGCR